MSLRPRTLFLDLALVLVAVLGLMPNRAEAGGLRERDVTLAGPGLGGVTVPFAPELGTMLLAPPPVQTPSGGPGATIPVKPTPTTPNEDEEDGEDEDEDEDEESSFSPVPRRP